MPSTKFLPPKLALDLTFIHAPDFEVQPDNPSRRGHTALTLGMSRPQSQMSPSRTQARTKSCKPFQCRQPFLPITGPAVRCAADIQLTIRAQWPWARRRQPQPKSLVRPCISGCHRNGWPTTGAAVRHAAAKIRPSHSHALLVLIQTFRDRSIRAADISFAFGSLLFPPPDMEEFLSPINLPSFWSRHAVAAGFGGISSFYVCIIFFLLLNRYISTPLVMSTRWSRSSTLSKILLKFITTRHAEF